MIDIKQVETIVTSINNDISDLLGVVGFFPASIRSDGYATAVEFLSQVMWHSDEDDREEGENGELTPPLNVHIRKCINEFINDLWKINLDQRNSLLHEEHPTDALYDAVRAIEKVVGEVDETSTVCEAWTLIRQHMANVEVAVRMLQELRPQLAVSAAKIVDEVIEGLRG